MLRHHSGWVGLVEKGRRFEEGASEVGRGQQGRDAKGWPQRQERRTAGASAWEAWAPGLPFPLPGSQAESKQAGQSVFRRGLLNRLQQEYQTREQLRARSMQGWVCYVTFICNIFDYLRVRPRQPHPVQQRQPTSSPAPLSQCSGPCSPLLGEQHAHDGPGEPRL